MSLTLEYHPFAQFYHKVPIALYETGIEVETRVIPLLDAADKLETLAIWAIGSSRSCATLLANATCRNPKVDTRKERSTVKTAYHVVDRQIMSKNWLPKSMDLIQPVSTAATH
jgi:hypothetical protein